MAQTLPAPPFVGRRTERDAYQQVLREERGPWLLDISGQGGNGKSRLLARRGGWEPTQAGLVALGT